ncbi:hypothetical protein RB2501_01056 [Robiginitalea biformata HTCC2501]|uniref:Uncharacterized protein n=1 Tax=Robiginitalea biformata (strain ATCC BAA-864 / DSM 15991 / KCTC 12146 / HTCC2501) TaxID=313596 RepID=A4CP04_ROBBH|nr:hypothetical protein RB2501_01056 [Robiginitalea biformata HTCC2501]
MPALYIRLTHLSRFFRFIRTIIPAKYSGYGDTYGNYESTEEAG